MNLTKQNVIKIYRNGSIFVGLQVHNSAHNQLSQTVEKWEYLFLRPN